MTLTTIGSPDAYAADNELDRVAARYAFELLELLAAELREVVRLREPAILPFIEGDRDFTEARREEVPGILEAWGIWFQLLNIAEENTAMRRRRQTEAKRGLHQVPGTFAHVFAEARSAGIDATEIQSVLDRCHIRPTLTAHPTEAKRVTVLQIHRRIYVLLYHLEEDRWTARERHVLLADLRNEIDLLWLTGELRMEKPSVSQEVAWGLHFFQQSLYARIPETLNKLEWSLREVYPEASFQIPPFFQFGSWIGGDRDGNPNVTNRVTENALMENRRAVLARYSARLEDIIQKLSISESTIELTPQFRDALNARLAASTQGKNCCDVIRVKYFVST